MSLLIQLFEITHIYLLVQQQCKISSVEDPIIVLIFNILY